MQTMLPLTTPAINAVEKVTIQNKKSDPKAAFFTDTDD